MGYSHGLPELDATFAGRARRQDTHSMKTPRAPCLASCSLRPPEPGRPGSSPTPRPGRQRRVSPPEPARAAERSGRLGRSPRLAGSRAGTHPRAPGQLPGCRVSG